MNKQITKAIILMVALAGLMLPGSVVMASDAGAFVGGMLASRVLTNMGDRTKAEQQQAYYAQQQAQQRPVQQAAPAAAPAAPQTKEQKMAELDKLAAGGYITPDEYKARKKAILDS